MINLVRPFFLFLAGVLASIIGRLIIPTPSTSSNKYLLTILILMTFFLFFEGIGLISMVIQRYYCPWRKKDHVLLHPKIGILNDIGDDKETFSWTDISPQEWLEEIKKQAGKYKIKTKVELINVKKNFDYYVTVLNPYGGVYPEHDMKTFKTLSKMFDYVNKGGLFVWTFALFRSKAFWISAIRN